jgi:hypothetical protein
MKRVLIITYYWPPSGGAGVQRWLKFTKYLREYRWEPVIYTPANPEIPEIDNSLQKDIPERLTVLKQPIWEPYNIYKLITFSRKKRINVGFLSEKKKPGLSEVFSVWMRSNFFIPDARSFWIKPSVRYLKKYLNENPVDAIVSTGPPHSMHIIAMKVKKIFGRKIKWVADFRDPWTGIDFYRDLKLSGFSDSKHHRLEMEVLQKADSVITIGKNMAEDFNRIYKRHYEVITNGFDTDDSTDISAEPDKKFSISHIGTMPRSRNPQVLWKALQDLTEKDREFADLLEIKLIGKIDISIKENLAECRLERYVKRTEYLQHDEVIKAQRQSQLLLLLVNQTENAKGILTGKFFEYLAAKRPILCIGPTDGEIAQIISETKAGRVVDFCNYDELKRIIKEYFMLYKEGRLNSESINIDRYSRRELTKRLAEELDLCCMVNTIE